MIWWNLLENQGLWQFRCSQSSEPLTKQTSGTSTTGKEVRTRGSREERPVRRARQREVLGEQEAPRAHPSAPRVYPTCAQSRAASCQQGFPLPRWQCPRRCPPSLGGRGFRRRALFPSRSPAPPLPAQCGRRARRGAVALRWRREGERAGGSGRAAGGRPGVLAFPFPSPCCLPRGGGSGIPRPCSPSGCNLAEPSAKVEAKRCGGAACSSSHRAPAGKRGFIGINVRNNKSHLQCYYNICHLRLLIKPTSML